VFVLRVSSTVTASTVPVGTTTGGAGGGSFPTAGDAAFGALDAPGAPPGAAPLFGALEFGVPPHPTTQTTVTRVSQRTICRISIPPEFIVDGISYIVAFRARSRTSDS